MTIVWDSGKVSEGLDLTESARPGILTFLKQLLDDYHSTAQTENYYDLLAGDWIDKFIHVSYAAWKNGLSGAEHLDETGIRVPGDLRAFNLWSTDLRFHEYFQAVIHRILEGASPAEWAFQQESADISQGATHWRKKLISTILGPRRPAVWLCCPYAFNCSKQEWLKTLWQWRSWARWDDMIQPIWFSCRVDQDWRRKRATEATPARDFPELLRTLLPLHIPAVLLEGFSRFRETALGFKFWRPRALYTANALSDHFTFKLLAAEWRKEGTVILNHQHGGGYGVDRMSVVENYETRVADRFYSWGWKRPDRPVVPLSPPYPARYPKNPHRLLLMCSGYPPTVHRLHYHPMPGTIEIITEQTVQFLSLLQKCNAVMIRLNPGNNGFRFKKHFQRAAPSAVFDETLPNAFRRYAESRLVVHNYVGTSFLETLALNLPTICFYPPNTYQFRSEAQKYIDPLREVGILHTSGLEAARWVHEVMADPAVWWQNSHLQDARQAFVHQYANYSPHWAADWEAEFKQWFE